MKNDNIYIKNQCRMLISQLIAFESGIETAARKDDGKIDADEMKTVKKLTSEAEAMKKTLEKYL